MEKSKASWQLRQALKRRTRKWRRRQVVGFYAFMFLWVAFSLGRDHHGWLRFLWAVYPVAMTWGAGTRWFQMQRRIVASLDDWAQVRHGLNFDQLAEAEQKEILRKKLLGFRLVLDSEGNVDERQEAFRLQAKDTAYRILKTGLPWFVAVYWALYLIVPAGYATRALMDAPTVVSWLAVFVVTLTSAIEMWTEPDEVGEARAV
jgi:hypothetical protein